MESDATYFRRRALEERLAALKPIISKCVGSIGSWPRATMILLAELITTIMHRSELVSGSSDLLRSGACHLAKEPTSR
jgi:hypothetical protein